VTPVSCCSPPFRPMAPAEKSFDEMFHEPAVPSVAA
jgi:hypothetical protein